jgi:metal-responsive CopG/Arc/MetJ family transcriptional regulator
MIRTQVQLPEEDLAELRRRAAEEGVSVSELVRRGVRQTLDGDRKPSRRELMRRALEVAGKYNSGRPDIAQRHDGYLAEAYADDSIR